MAKQWLSPEQIQERHNQTLEELTAQAQIVTEELARLVTQPGWKYVKAIAAIHTKEFACKPPKTEEERIQWETYTTLKWVIDKVFADVEEKAAHRQPSEQPKPNDNQTSRRTTARKRPTGINIGARR